MKSARNILVIVSVLIVIATIIFAWSTRNKSEVIKDKPFNELVAEALKIRVEGSRKCFEVALLVLAALWALIIAKKDEAGILLSDTPECGMFLCAHILLIGSAAYHVIFLSKIEYVYSLAGGLYKDKGPFTIPDVFDSYLSNPYYVQLSLLVGGIVITALTLFSAHRLKT